MYVQMCGLCTHSCTYTCTNNRIHPTSHTPCYRHTHLSHTHPLSHTQQHTPSYTHPLSHTQQNTHTQHNAHTHNKKHTHNKNHTQDAFWTRITLVRGQELDVLWKSFVVGALNVFLLNVIPTLVSVTTFGMYVVLGNELTATKAV